MEQKKYINSLLDKASSQKKRSDSIQKAYENYINSGSTTEMELIIHELDEQLFILYCRAFTESTAFPPRSLALYYARVLPHLLEAIPDNKASSAKWAFEYMTDRTLFHLKDDSESYLQTNVSRHLAWCTAFLKQMDSIEEDIDKSRRLGDVIYTKHFSKGKIEDWAEYMHKVCTKTAMTMVIENKTLLEAAKSYLSTNDVLYKLVKGGHSR